MQHCMHQPAGWVSEGSNLFMGHTPRPCQCVLAVLPRCLDLAACRPHEYHQDVEPAMAPFTARIPELIAALDAAGADNSKGRREAVERLKSAEAEYGFARRLHFGTPASAVSSQQPVGASLGLWHKETGAGISAFTVSKAC